MALGPRVLLIGAQQEDIERLVLALQKQGRDVTGTASPEAAQEMLTHETVDIVVLGAGLDDDAREAMRALVGGIRPKVPVYAGPYPDGAEGMVERVNKIVTEHE